jgi:riboflavin kinase/FMN adenylyltransferase
LTFEPHPAAVLAPDRAPPRLQSSSQRLRIARALGVDCLAEVPFNLEVAALEPAQFVDRYLIEGLAPETVIVGEDFRYGKGAAGTTRRLGDQLHTAGIDLEVLPQLDDAEGNKIGSSEIRRYLEAGQLEAANRLLGYDHAVSGVVEHGAQRGRELGFPTANLRCEALVPASGVYAGWLTIHGDSPARDLPEGLPAVANIGTNPTFVSPAEATTSVEVHAIDQALGESLYGLEVEFSFVARLRDERRFEGAEALKLAIADDVSIARSRLASLDSSSRRPPPVRRA